MGCPFGDVDRPCGDVGLSALADLAGVAGLAGFSAPASLLRGAFLVVVDFAASLGSGEVGLPGEEVGFL